VQLLHPPAEHREAIHRVGDPDGPALLRLESARVDDEASERDLGGGEGDELPCPVDRCAFPRAASRRRRPSYRAGTGTLRPL
jgi:hypothetical protein